MLISASRLPPALVDLTFLRVSATSTGQVPRESSSKWNTALCRGMRTRKMHQAVLAREPESYQYSAEVDVSNPSIKPSGKGRFGYEGTIAARSPSFPTQHTTELERRVQALQQAITSEEIQLNHSALSEEELLNIYEDLLAIPQEAKRVHLHVHDEVSQSQADQALIHNVDQRLLDTERLPRDAPLPITNALLNRRTQGPKMAQGTLESTGVHPQDTAGPLEEPYRRVLSRMQEVILQVETVQSSIFSSTNNVVDSTVNTMEADIPISILSPKEWEALVRICLHHEDAQAAEMSLDLMRRSGLCPAEESINAVLGYYTEDGNIQRAEDFMAKILIASPTELQRDLHIKCHIKAAAPNQIPTTALSLLHKYETQSLPAPMRTYTRLITSLFSSRSSVGHAQAWDLFSHMRYVAHPDPDAQLYTLMIRACGSSLIFPSEPERALDLWTEMTVDHGIPPTTGAYSAVILACARSGTKAYVNEAFRLAKQMFDAHRDAYGRSQFMPDTRTFCALLEGAKRVGDLARTRWILAEMVKWSGNGKEGKTGEVDAEVNEEVMMHVFHAYASYRPPFRRAATLLKDDPKGQAESSPQESKALQGTTQDDVVAVDEQPTFSHIPPQSRPEVVAEARTLFNRVLRDTRQDGDQSYHGGVFSAHRVFENVKLTARLLNSYLSVYYNHSSLEVSEKLFRSLFDDLAVRRNARSYVEALERCTLSRKGHERTAALAFAKHLWLEWEELESRLQYTPDDDNSFSPRLVERAHVAMIRILTLTGDLECAFNHVKAFVYRYPTSAVSQTPPKSSLRSTRTVLVAPRPLVRMTSTVQVPDDKVPPLLTFTDLELLHHRLVAANKGDMIKYIKFVCKAYEGALRTRRSLAMRSEPTHVDDI